MSSSDTNDKGNGLLKCATHSSAAACGGNLKASLDFTVTYGNHSMKKSVFYASQTSAAAIHCPRRAGRIGFPEP